MIGSSLASRARELLRIIQNYKNAKLLAVSKGMPIEAIQQAASLGIRSFGENYVQEWKEKTESLGAEKLEWHFIGHLQTNKVKEVAGKVELIQSCDRMSLAESINKHCLLVNRIQDVLIEVNLAGEESKSGVSLEAAPELITKIVGLRGIRICGMMVLPPFSEDPERSRPYFQKARVAFESLKKLVEGDAWQVLSMGTSQDYQVALDEGSNLIRVGTALFGPRK